MNRIHFFHYNPNIAQPTMKFPCKSIVWLKKILLAKFDTSKKKKK